MVLLDEIYHWFLEISKNNLRIWVKWGQNWGEVSKVDSKCCVVIKQSDHLKQKLSKFLCVHSLVLEVKGLKQGYILKNRPFYISFVLFNTFPSRSEHSKKKVFKKKKKYRTYLP